MSFLPAIRSLIILSDRLLYNRATHHFSTSDSVFFDEAEILLILYASRRASKNKLWLCPSTSFQDGSLNPAKQATSKRAPTVSLSVAMTALQFSAQPPLTAPALPSPVPSIWGLQVCMYTIICKNVYINPNCFPHLSTCSVAQTIDNFSKKSNISQSD